ncbi:hypothetical protein Hanom_Chr04g00370661 [Helianthus anomalus]
MLHRPQHTFTLSYHVRVAINHQSHMVLGQGSLFHFSFYNKLKENKNKLSSKCIATTKS